MPLWVGVGLCPCGADRASSLRGTIWGPSLLGGTDSHPLPMTFT